MKRHKKFSLVEYFLARRVTGKLLCLRSGDGVRSNNTKHENAFSLVRCSKLISAFLLHFNKKSVSANDIIFNEFSSPSFVILILIIFKKIILIEFFYHTKWRKFFISSCAHERIKRWEKLKSKVPKPMNFNFPFSLWN